MGIPYSTRELEGKGPQQTFKGDQLQQIAFPLGGIGAGCLHLGGAGNFQDFCLFNAPAFGHSPMTFAAVHCGEQGRKEGVLRVLEGPVQAPHIYNQGRFGNGGLAAGHEGLPHMEKAQFRGEFPFAWVTLADQALPLRVGIEAYSPFIPGDDLASGIPAAFLKYTLHNRGKRKLKVQFSFNAQYPEKAGLHGHKAHALKGHRVYQRRQGDTAGIYFASDLPGDHPRKTSIAIVSPLSGQQANCAWFRGGWFDALTVLTNQLLKGQLKQASRSRPALEGGHARFGATLFWDLDLAPGDQLEIPLIYCWHVPNTEQSYGRDPAAGSNHQPDTYQPYYATQFANAWAVGRYALSQGQTLLARSRAFHKALFSTSIPNYAIEAVAANLAILKSPTVLRQKDGMLWCWEGSSYGHGCCAGSCTHVWNYAQALPYLFPALERTLRDQELAWSMDEGGHVTFRSALPTGQVGHTFHAASDGQLGGIIKTYREWLLCGDREWLEKRYPLVRRSLEYCIRTWDPDGKGALIEPHHNTYDIEFWGPDVMCTSFYLGALEAAAALAQVLNEKQDMTRYRTLATRGRAFVDQQLWNGQYYEQKVQWKGLRAGGRLRQWLKDPGHKNDAGYSQEALKILRREGPKYQYGAGCISDGVMGQWLTTMVGLPDALNRRRTRSHLKAIFRHNFRNSLQGHANPQRPGYALNGEPGLLLCSWPKGGKPSLPFVYSDEVWTGIEYQVASHMIYEDLVSEGLTLVKAVRQRYDGRVRNPWNEYECGNYYARAMASYGVLLALAGFRYQAAEERLTLAPKLAGAQGRFFFAVDGAWGQVSYRVARSTCRVRVAVEEGALAVRQLQVGGVLAKSMKAKVKRVETETCRRALPGKALVFEFT